MRMKLHTKFCTAEGSVIFDIMLQGISDSALRTTQIMILRIQSFTVVYAKQQCNNICKITEEEENNFYFTKWLRFFLIVIGLISTSKNGIYELLVTRRQWAMS